MRPFNTGFLGVCSVILACSQGPGGAPDSGTPDSGGGLCSFAPSNVDISQLDFTGVEDVLLSHDQSIQTDLGGLLGGSGHSNYKEITQSNGLKLGVFTVKSLTIAAGVTVTVTGADGLVIVALGDITIDGKLFGSSAREQGVKGPGATEQSGNDNVPGSGLGGGAAGSGTSSAGGGGYCGAGGDGAAFSGTASKGGASFGNATLVPLVAGSNGGTGGVGSGGNGGGAIQLSACGAMHVTGVVHVGGAGGVASGVYDPQNVISQQASGGGSGGSILLEGASVSTSGTLAANGGGGGGSTTGSDSTGDATPASGGASTTQAAAGGNGAAGATTDGQPGKSQATSTSGAGGGAAGRIRINAKSTPTLGGTISPAIGTCTTQGVL